MFFLTFVVIHANAQTYEINGIIVDAIDSTPLFSAAVMLTDCDDSSLIGGVLTDANGFFSLTVSTQGVFCMRISSLGYNQVELQINVRNPLNQLGSIKVDPLVLQTSVFELRGHVPRVLVKGDTIQFATIAYATNPDATAEYLMSKLPGIVIVNGRVVAFGETVQQIFIDGKPVSTENISILENIPAEIISKIQLYDKLSDQARATGVDDGKSMQVINIITKPSKRNGYLAKTLLSYGTDNRYTMSGYLHHQNNDQLIMGEASSNNVRVGRSGGIGQFDNFGVSYDDSLAKSVRFASNYGYGRNSNIIDISETRSYFNGAENSVYSETANSSSRGNTHNLRSKFEYNDGPNAFTMSPSLKVAKNAAVHKSNAEYKDSDLSSFSKRTSQGQATSYDIQNDLFLSHRLRKQGRIVSCQVTGTILSESAENENLSENWFTSNDETKITQVSVGSSKDLSVSTNLSFTEPISKGHVLQLSYKPDFKKIRYEKLIYEQHSSILDSALSSRCVTTYLKNEVAMSYKHTVNSALTIGGDLSFRSVQLEGHEQIQSSSPLGGKIFTGLFPSAKITWKGSPHKSLSIEFQSMSNLPTLTQLNNVVNSQNPLFITSGNANLQEQRTQFLSCRYTMVEKSGSSLIGLFSGRRTTNSISYTSFIASDDTMLSSGFLLHKGAQFTMPVNLESGYSLRTQAIFSKPLKMLKSNLNINIAFENYSMPIEINSTIYAPKTYQVSMGCMLSSSNAGNLDYTFSYTPSFSVLKNSLGEQSTTRYYHRGNINIYWSLTREMQVLTDLSCKVSHGALRLTNQQELLWNMSLSKKLFRKLGDLRFSIFNILNENSNIMQRTNDYYSQETASNTVGRYYAVSFIYHLRKFKEPKN